MLGYSEKEDDMGIFGLVKDIVLLPVDVALDITCITPAARVVSDCNHDTPFGTVDRLESLARNLDDTLD